MEISKYCCCTARTMSQLDALQDAIDLLKCEVENLKRDKLERVFEWHAADDPDTIPIRSPLNGFASKPQKWVLWDRTTEVVFWDVVKRYSDIDVNAAVLDNMLLSLPLSPPLNRIR